MTRMTFTSEARKAEFDKALRDPGMDGWQRAIMRLAEEWAINMEALINQGRQISDGGVVSTGLDMCKSAATDSSRMVQGAKGLLHGTWAHGEELSKRRVS